jgi:hypothetical protein
MNDSLKLIELFNLGLTGNILLTQAIKSKNEALANHLLANKNEYDINLDELDSNKNNFLHLAIKKGFTSDFILKLSQFLDVNTLDSDCNNALMLSIIHQNFNAAQVIFEKIENLNQSNKNQESTIELLSKSPASDEFFMQFLDKTDYDIVEILNNRINQKCNISFLFNVYEKKIEKEKLINQLLPNHYYSIQAKVLPNILKAYQGHSVEKVIDFTNIITQKEISMIYRSEKIDLIDRLLERGWRFNYANFKTLCDEKPTVLKYYLAQYKLGQHSIIKSKKEFDELSFLIDLNEENTQEDWIKFARQQKLLIFIKNNWLKQIKNNADFTFNYQDNKGQNLYYYANSIPTMDYLYEKNIDINHQTKSFNCLLNIIDEDVYYNEKLELNLKKAQWLIEKGIDLNYRNSQGNNAFSFLCKMNKDQHKQHKEKFFKLLLTTPIDKDEKLNVIHLINNGNYTKCIKMWLNHGLTLEKILEQSIDSFNNSPNYMVFYLINTLIAEKYDLSSVHVKNQSFLGVTLKLLNHWEENETQKNHYNNLNMYELIKKMILGKFQLTQEEMGTTLESSLTVESVKEYYQVIKTLQEKNQLETYLITHKKTINKNNKI